MQTVTDARTIGLSPKAALAFMYPTLVTVTGVIASWIVTGALDVAELRAAGAGLLLAAIAALGAVVGSTGTVRLPRRPGARTRRPGQPAAANDELLAAAGGHEPPADASRTSTSGTRPASRR